MKQHKSRSNRLIICICCIFIVCWSILPVQAAKRSNGLAITLLISGVGLQVGSTFLNTSAETKYEDYLSASLQADIETYKNDTITRRNASVIMSRLGYGCVGLAVILSIFNQLENATIETSSVTHSHNRINQTLSNTFSLVSSNLSLKNRIVGEAQKFSFRPHYDFQRHRASIQFLHRF